MDFLKKWASCIFSFIAGALGLVLSLCTGMTKNISVSSDVVAPANISQVENIKAHKVLTDSNLASQAETYKVSGEFSWLKAFSIIMTVVSILLVVYAIIMLLKNLDVIKVGDKVFDITGIVLSACLLFAVVGLFISSISYANAIEKAVTNALSLQFASYISVVSINVNFGIGIYQWIMLFVGILISVASTTFIVLKRKDA